MPMSIRLGRVFGIPIGLHYSWFVIAGLITLSLGGQFSLTHPAWGRPVIWSAAVATSMLFFASIVLHELAHAVVARAGHLPVRSITLFALGGVAQIERDASSAGREFWMAIAGPLASVAIGLACLTGAHAAGWTMADGSPDVLPTMFGWLGYINVALAIFNLIPGYPLDGGRVLRAVLWYGSGDMTKATTRASAVGQVVAFLLIGYGLAGMLLAGRPGGLWLAVIGWFLLQSSRASQIQAVVLDRLRGLRVADVMSREQPTVDGATSLQAWVNDVLRSGQPHHLVVRDGAVAGVVTPDDVKRVPRDGWANTPVSAVMRPLASVRTVSPETPISEAFELLGREPLGELPVVSEDEHRLEGVLTREHIQRIVQAHADVGARA